MIITELAFKRTKQHKGRAERAVTLKQMEALCAKIRSAGGKDNTPVKAARGSDGGIRLVAQVD